MTHNDEFVMDAPAAVDVRADAAPLQLLQATYPDGILPSLVAKATGDAYLPVDDPGLYPDPPPPPDEIASGESDDPFSPVLREAAGEQAQYPADILPLSVAKAITASDAAIDPGTFPPPPPPPSDTASGSDPILPPPAALPPENVTVPAVTQDAETLACTMGTWTGEPILYSYAWQLDGVAAGTDEASLTVTADDIGKLASCTVTATNDAGSTTAPPSNELTVAAFT